MFVSPGNPTYGNVYRSEANKRLVAQGYSSSIANDWTKIPAIFRWLFGIFRSNTKCLYGYYTIFLETPDDIFRNRMVPRNTGWETPHEPFFLILPPIHVLVSHVVHSFQLQLFLLKLMQFPSSCVLYVSPIPGSVRWSTLYSVQKKEKDQNPTLSNFFFPLGGEKITCKYS